MILIYDDCRRYSKMKTNCRKHTSENEQFKIIFLATFKCNIVFGKKNPETNNKRK